MKGARISSPNLDRASSGDRANPAKLVSTDAMAEDDSGDDYDLYNLGQPSWLSVPSSNFDTSGALTCNQTSWSEPVRFDTQDVFNSLFLGLKTTYMAAAPDDKANYADITAAYETMPTLKFGLVRYLACDSHAESLKTNMFVDEQDATARFEEYITKWVDWTKKLFAAYRKYNLWTEAQVTRLNNQYAAYGDIMKNFYLPVQMGKKSKNTKELRENLFMDDIKVSTDYDKYFAACDVKKCTYTYEADISAAMLASIILGLIGGVTTVLGSLARALYSVTKYVIIYGRNAEDSTAAAAAAAPASEKEAAAPGETDFSSDNPAAAKETESAV